jgi:hypothetical protein
MQNHEKNTQNYVENPYIENPNQNTKKPREKHAEIRRKSIRRKPKSKHQESRKKRRNRPPLLIVDRLQSVLETHACFVKKS